MADQYAEPAAFIFPLPDQLKEHYLKWLSEKQQGGNGEPGPSPVLVPVYPAYPGFVPCPAFCPAARPETGPRGGGAVLSPPGINPFILFLILFLLVIIFKKDEIASAIRKLLLKTEKKSPPG